MATAEQPQAAGAEHSAPLPRDEFIAILQAQPADSTYEELIHELMVRREVRRGMEDVEEGRVFSHEEVLKEIQTWRK